MASSSSASSSSSSSSCKWSYAVFPSFSGVDVRRTFLSHFLKELDRRLIIAFIDNGIERSRSLEPELIQAIRDSRIMVVIFSKHYASSSWCLTELVEIVKCKEDLGQLVVPVFYGLDPTDVRKQIGEFGEEFDKTCCNKTADEIQLWRNSLTAVSNIAGYHSQSCGNEAELIESIANDVSSKLNYSPTKDFENFVGLEDHMAKMSSLLRLDLDEVRMVGIWGASGIGKTTIARALFNRLSGPFRSSIFIDRAFVSKSLEIFSLANADDYNMKLHLQAAFLSKILDQADINLDHLGVVEERLRHMKVLVVFDDLDKRLVLEALAGKTQWFGCGSRIIVVTKDKHILRSHGIDHIYQVGLPSEEIALEMFCRYAFRQKSPPDDFKEGASKVIQRAGSLPLGLNVLGAHFRGRDKEGRKKMLPRVLNMLDGDIEKTLRLGYDGLLNEVDKQIFRHIACLFNGEKVKDINELLADSYVDVSIGLENLVDKSLINVRDDDIVEMHGLLQEMGREIVRATSEEPGEREFLVDAEDICKVLCGTSGTTNVLGIALDIDEINELRVHERAFNEMPNLCFLKMYTKTWMLERNFRWHLPTGFNYLPSKLRLLCWDRYPLSYMPSKFHPDTLIKLIMRRSKLKMLGEGVELHACLHMDFSGSEHLKTITNLSMAINLETLNLSACLNLKELSRSSIENLNSLVTLDLSGCTNLEALPDDINLQSLHRLNLHGCSKLKRLPDLSRNISELFVSQTGIEEIPCDMRLDKLVDLRMHELKSTILWSGPEPLTAVRILLSPTLTRLYLSDIPTLRDLPSYFECLNNLMDLRIKECESLENLPDGINLKSLSRLNFSRCSQLRTFPDISTSITRLYLFRTGIEEVPCWIDKFSKLEYMFMANCYNLRNVSLNICKSKYPDTGTSTEASCYDRVPVVALCFVNCFSLDPYTLLRQQAIIKHIILPGGQVPLYFTHRTAGNSLTNIPLLMIQSSLSSQVPFFGFRACAVFEESLRPMSCSIDIKVSCRFKSRLGNHFDSTDQICSFWTYQRGRHMVIFDCRFPLHDENSPHPAQLNYDHVDILFHLTDNHSKFSLKGCGIRLPNDTTPFPDSCASNSVIIEDITETAESDTDNDGGNEVESSNVEIEKRKKPFPFCFPRFTFGKKRHPANKMKRD